MPHVLQSRVLKAAALVGSGFAFFTRAKRAMETTILTFHGLSEDAGDPGILDWSLHLPVDVFQSICAMLAADYHVVSLQELIEARRTNTSLPGNSVVLTFDDGYASNYELAYPLLREYHLPATVFVTTGFLDGEDMLWFQRVDLALGHTRRESVDWKINGKKLRLSFATREARQRSLVRLMAELKELPDTDLLNEVHRLEEVLEVSAPTAMDLPQPMRPMTWNMLRAMSNSGLVEFGGHTHTHPILSRCDSFAMRAEITACRDRLFSETGIQPVAFSYPNGRPEDYTRETLLLVRDAGYQCACTTTNGRIDDSSSLFQLPRYGSPESVWEAEATVSGAFETLKQWRQSCLKAVSLV